MKQEFPRPADYIDLSGQVAIITGGGRGIGKACASLLAQRGAAVVVNDSGTSPDGEGRDPSVAEMAAKEIRDAGGRATASPDDICDPEAGAAIVQVALDNFGRVDIFIHCAGIGGGAPFAELSLAHFHKVFAVNVLGALHVGQPAWARMLSQGYGRVVLLTSGAIFGTPGAIPYTVSKAGIVGLGKTLAAEGAAQAAADIKVNMLAPNAATRRGGPAGEVFGSLGDPSLVAAVIGYLASIDCSLNGQILEAGASFVGRLFLAATQGWAKRAVDLTPEDVAAHIGDALDLEGYFIPETGLDTTRHVAEVVVGEEAASARLDRWLATFEFPATHVKEPKPGGI